MGFKSLAEAFAQTPTLTIFVVIAWTAFGLLIGSFLNVVIYRVPRSMSIALPPSHCPYVQHAVVRARPTCRCSLGWSSAAAAGRATWRSRPAIQP